MPTAAGRIHSAELIASERAQMLLRSMRVSDEKNLFIFDLPPVFANDDAATAMARLDAYIVVAEEGKTKQREVQDAVRLLGESRLAGVILNKYRGGVVSEGYGVDDYYAAGYGGTEPSAAVAKPNAAHRRCAHRLLLRRRRREALLIFDLRGVARPTSAGSASAVVACSRRIAATAIGRACSPVIGAGSRETMTLATAWLPTGMMKGSTPARSRAGRTGPAG